MLATLSMWFEKLDKQEAINLISDKFNFEELWVAALELNQLCADRSMSKKIPKNQDQGDLSDRVKVLALAMYGSIQELKGRVDNPTFVVSSMQLCNVPGVVTDNVKAEPVVTARLDSIEKLIENLNKDLKEMKASNSRVEQFPALQVNGVAANLAQGPPNNFRRRNMTPDPRARSTSPSVKRTADESEAETHTGQQQDDGSWSKVVRGNRGNGAKIKKPRPTQLGTA